MEGAGRRGSSSQKDLLLSKWRWPRRRGAGRELLRWCHESGIFQLVIYATHAAIGVAPVATAATTTPKRELVAACGVPGNSACRRPIAADAARRLGSW